MLWVLSNEWPQALHSYSYVGTAPPRSGSTNRIFWNILKIWGIVKDPAPAADVCGDSGIKGQQEGQKNHV
jgi:hypothetical protein